MQRLLHAARQALVSPSRNPRFAVVIGRLLGAAFVICFLTGLYSHLIQDPFPGMHFPTRPIWLYGITQGLHVTSGLACFPLIFAKLYAVYPQLFQTPPVRGPIHLLERASIALFVASSLVEITIGQLNTYQWYQLFPFPFRQTHFALAFVVIGSLAIHIAVKLPLIQRYWRRADAYDADGNVRPVEFDPHSRPHDDGRATGREVAGVAVAAFAAPAAEHRGSGGTDPRGTDARGADAAGTDARGTDAAPATIATHAPRGLTGRILAWIDATPPPASSRTSRRGFMVGTFATLGTAVALFVGQSFRPLDAINVFAPRKDGIGPNRLPVNKTAKSAGVIESAMDPAWSLEVKAGDTVRTFTRAQLAALPQFEVDLPIACVEGWSQLAHWKGPRLKDLMDAVGAHGGATVRAVSLQKNSVYARTEMEPEFVRDDLTLVALEVDGAVLDIDHGYPARLIAPARPGVLQTKWLSSLEAIR